MQKMWNTRRVTCQNGPSSLQEKKERVSFSKYPQTTLKGSIYYLKLVPGTAEVLEADAGGDLPIWAALCLDEASDWLGGEAAKSTAVECRVADSVWHCLGWLSAGWVFLSCSIRSLNDWTTLLTEPLQYTDVQDIAFVDLRCSLPILELFPSWNWSMDYFHWGKPAPTKPVYPA